MDLLLNLLQSHYNLNNIFSHYIINIELNLYSPSYKSHNFFNCNITNKFKFQNNFKLKIMIHKNI